MKKLIMMAAVCATAFAAQAFSVNWSCTNVRIPLADDVTKDQTGIKVTTSSTAFDAGALTLNIFWQEKGGTTTHLITSKPNSASGSLTNVPIISTGDDVYNAIVGTDAGQWAAGDKPNFVVTATYKTKDGVYEFSGTYQPAKSIGNVNSGNVVLSTSMTNGTWNYTAAPEPTSGLLLLLGVAGLALRRRRA